MVERIQKILDHYKLSASHLAEKLGVQRSNISHIMSGRNKPSLDLIQKILTAFPEVSSDWMLFNKGSMIEEEEVIPKAPKPVTPTPPKRETKKVSTSPTMFEPPISTPSPVSKPVKPKESKKKRTPKKAKRIIIFNEDNTFTEYYPDED